jgi:hypothetical protein
MQCAPAFFKDGFVAGFYRLGERALEHLLDVSDREFRVRLLMLEVWGRLFFQGESESELTAELLRQASIDPV